MWEGPIYQPQKFLSEYYNSDLKQHYQNQIQKILMINFG